jgi:hypothetical protein
MKKKLFPVALLVLVSATVSGCPVYDDGDGCYNDYDCSVGFYCDYPSGACLSEGSGSYGACSEPDDCAPNETCSKSGICAAGNCHFPSVGCVRGFECSGESGRWECVREGSSSGVGGEGSGGAPPSEGGAPATSGGSGGEAGAPMSGAGAPAGGAAGEPMTSAGAGGT